MQEDQASLSSELLVDLRRALGRRIAQLRETQGLTQGDLADRVGMSQPRWSNIERGETDARLSTLLRVQYALDLPSFESLFGIGSSARRLHGFMDGYGKDLGRDAGDAGSQSPTATSPEVG